MLECFWGYSFFPKRETWLSLAWSVFTFYVSRIKPNQYLQHEILLNGYSLPAENLNPRLEAVKNRGQHEQNEEDEQGKGGNDGKS